MSVADGLSPNGANMDGGNRHSGRAMISAMASRITGLSTPDMPFCVSIMSNSPLHHLSRTFTLLSRCSGSRFLVDG